MKPFHIITLREWHLPFIAVVCIRELAPTARANQLPVPTLAPYPQLQSFGFFVDLVAIDSIPRPSQHLRPIVFSHRSESVTRVVENPKRSFDVEVLQILVRVGFLDFWHLSGSSSRRCGNVESRVLCGFPSSEGGNENAFTKLTLPPSERHFHSEAPGSAASLSDFVFRQH